MGAVVTDKRQSINRAKTMAVPGLNSMERSQIHNEIMLSERYVMPLRSSVDS